jgi:ParB-like chromosome segregation protein Spo0J
VTEIALREPELVAVADLTAHPRNYRSHPDAQIQHLIASFRAFGVLPTVVVARDGTILGGHGVWITAQRLGVDHLLATRLDLDPGEPAALKLVAALNFSDRLALDDESALASLLADVNEGDVLGLLGTGLTADDLTNMIARADPRLPEGFRHLTPGEPDADALGDEPPTVAAMVLCPVCGHQFIPGDPR